MSFFFDNDEAAEPPKKRLNTEEGRRFDGVPHPTNESDDDGDDVPVLAMSGGRVGLKLLESMHQDQQQHTKSTATTTSSSRKMRVVESYVPLSVGGFMESTGETAGDLFGVQTGDVMCLRCPEKLLRREDEAPSSSIKEENPQPAGILFVKEADLTDEERRYGKRVTSNMAAVLFEVGRVDRVTHSLEAIFLDGTRQKLKVTAVRPAGFVEGELFRKWKSDPASRPVRTINAEDPKAKSPVAADSVAPGCSGTTEQQQQQQEEDQQKEQKETPQPSVPWWVVPQLIVRVVDESAGDMKGKKFVVSRVFRKERRIRLEPWRSEGIAASDAPHESVDIIGCEALETVLPKVGERGMVVLGAMRGELVTVVARRRNESGDLAVLQVSSMRTGSEFSVEPHELCQLRNLRKGGNNTE